MSDEYASTGYKGSLVNQSVNPRSDNIDFETKNYPSEHDSTSEGGYGSPTNSWSPRAQRGHPGSSDDNSSGLLSQSVMQDAKQGRDESSRRQFGHEAQRDFAAKDVHAGFDPYGRNPDSKEEVSQMLASSYRERREQKYESSSAGREEEEFKEE
ncbi:unnamed protein product [Somion occarium]|uniref:Uncharacterized protein n=1 Tax=Somion occarium TaxID=3059160 RepID=A0ABP1E9N4_9APHY